MPPPLRPVPPPIAPAKPVRRSRGIWVVAAIVLGVLLMIGSIVLPFAGAFMASGGMGTPHHLHEMVVEEADGVREKIGIINLDGVIFDQPDQWTGIGLVRNLRDQLDRMEDDDRVRAVILKINSPGGEVLASDEIYKLIQDFQERTDKPVIASMGSLAASGGYYVAAPCRWIVANELTITGSIGVIMSSYNWRGLLDKVGVAPQVFKSGRFKDMLSPDKLPSEITPEEKKMIQDLIDETYGKFRDVVAAGRAAAAKANGSEGRKLVDNWREYADGRVFSGKQAHTLGFVDELGNFDTAVERALTLAGIDDANLVQYVTPPSFADIFRIFGKAQPAKINIDLCVEFPKVRPGLLYFLSPTVLH
jgi:protease-4